MPYLSANQGIRFHRIVVNAKVEGVIHKKLTDGRLLRRIRRFRLNHSKLDLRNRNHWKEGTLARCPELRNAASSEYDEHCRAEQESR
jgi:hypothetical protein